MTTIRDLISKNFLKDGDRLIWNRRGLRVQHLAIVSSNGTLETEDGKTHKTPSGAAKHLGKKPVDGWLAWKLESSRESLDSIRKRYQSS